MINDLFSTGVFPILEKSLDTASLRQSVLADNIANVNTPNYKRKTVSFEEELKLALNRSAGDGLALARTHPNHLPLSGQGLASLRPEVQVDNNTLWRKDGNNVDIDVEMAEMARNTIKYQALTQKISGDFSQLRKAIEGR